MEWAPNSTAGQILALSEKGYTRKQIWLELRTKEGLGKLTRGRVSEVLRRADRRSDDSRRIFAIHEMLVEVLAAVRETATEKQRKRMANAARIIADTGAHQKVGEAIERLTEPSQRDNGA